MDRIAVYTFDNYDSADNAWRILSMKFSSNALSKSGREITIYSNISDASLAGQICRANGGH